MGEAVREMTEFEIECEKKINALEGDLKESEIKRKVVAEQKAYVENVLDNLRKREKEKCEQIERMQSHIDCLKTELEETQMNKPELPEEPIKVAEMLISATYTAKKCDVEKAVCRAFGNYSDESTYNVYSKADLRQIAEHLMVYCNHAEVE